MIVRRRGRPKGDPENAKSKPMFVKTGETEKNRFESAAHSSQKSLSEWVRDVCNAAADKILGGGTS